MDSMTAAETLTLWMSNISSNPPSSPSTRLAPVGNTFVELSPEAKHHLDAARLKAERDYHGGKFEVWLQKHQFDASFAGAAFPQYNDFSNEIKLEILEHVTRQNPRVVEFNPWRLSDQNARPAAYNYPVFMQIDRQTRDLGLEHLKYLKLMQPVLNPRMPQYLLFHPKIDMLYIQNKRSVIDMIRRHIGDNAVDDIRSVAIDLSWENRLDEHLASSLAEFKNLELVFLVVPYYSIGKQYEFKELRKELRKELTREDDFDDIGIAVLNSSRVLSLPYRLSRDEVGICEKLAARGEEGRKIMPRIVKVKRVFEKEQTQV